MKKIFCLCLFCLLLTVGLLACAAKDGETSSAPESADESSAAPQDASEAPAESGGESDSSEASAPEESSDAADASSEPPSESSAAASEPAESAAASSAPPQPEESSSTPSRPEESSSTPSKPEESSSTPSRPEESSSIPSEPEESSRPDESSTTSSEPPVEPAVKRAAKPEVYGCTVVESDCFVILGTCESGGRVVAKSGGQTVSSRSDHGYFSIRLERTSSSMQVELTVQVSGKEDSEALSYNAVPKSVSAEQWALIAGADYQFHIQYTLADYLRTNSYSASALESIRQRLESRLESIRSVSPETEVLYLLVPSPATVYPESMPSEYKPQDKLSRLEQVTTLLEDVGIHTFDLTALFEAHKNDEYKLYWKTDSHWTDYGAYLAYEALFDYISEAFPAAAPRQFSEFAWQEDYYYGGDISHYLEYYNVNNVKNGVYYGSTPLMREYNVLRVPAFSVPSQILRSVDRYKTDHILTYDIAAVQYGKTIQTNRPELPSAIIHRDSYSGPMYDILAERLDTTVYKSMWDYTVNLSQIKQMQPDYIIYLVAERNIGEVFPY